MYEVWTINDSGVYEMIEETDNPEWAAFTVKHLRARGKWVQMCKAGEMNIIGR